MDSFFFLGGFWGINPPGLRRYALLVICWFSLVAQNKDIGSASQTKLTKVRLHLCCRLTDLTYAPINSKLQHPPPPLPWQNPRHLTITCARGVENLIIAQVGWGIWTRNVKFNFKFYFFGWSGSDKVVRFIVAIFFSVRWRSKVKKQLL